MKSYSMYCILSNTSVLHYMFTFYSPHCGGRQNIQTINTTKQTNEQIEKHTNGSDISHNMNSS